MISLTIILTHTCNVIKNIWKEAEQQAVKLQRIQDVINILCDIILIINIHLFV